MVKREDTLEIKDRENLLFVGNLLKIGGVFGWFAVTAEDELMQPLANTCTEPCRCSKEKQGITGGLNILFIRQHSNILGHQFSVYCCQGSSYPVKQQPIPSKNFFFVRK